MGFYGKALYELGNVFKNIEVLNNNEESLGILSPDNLKDTLIFKQGNAWIDLSSLTTNDTITIRHSLVDQNNSLPVEYMAAPSETALGFGKNTTIPFARFDKAGHFVDFLPISFSIPTISKLNSWIEVDLNDATNAKIGCNMPESFSKIGIGVAGMAPFYNEANTPKDTCAFYFVGNSPIKTSVLEGLELGGPQINIEHAQVSELLMTDIKTTVWLCSTNPDEWDPTIVPASLKTELNFGDWIGISLPSIDNYGHIDYTGINLKYFKLPELDLSDLDNVTINQTVKWSTW